jgi:hypothetical protein
MTALAKPVTRVPLALYIAAAGSIGFLGGTMAGLVIAWFLP